MSRGLGRIQVQVMELIIGTESAHYMAQLLPNPHTRAMYNTLLRSCRKLQRAGLLNVTTLNGRLVIHPVGTTVSLR